MSKPTTPLRASLEVRRSAIAGKGLFSRAALPARCKIGELSGEVISLRESRRRTRNARVIAMVELGDRKALDATNGNEFRYVNHSCSPNTYMRVFRGRVEFYTLRQIRPGEELTCDYGETQHEGSLRCRCGSERCRVML